MLDFFTDNPILVIVIIFVIVRLLRGNKGKDGEVAPTAVQQNQTVSQSQQRQKGGRSRNQARRGRFQELKDSLENAMREADRQFGATTPSTGALPESAVAEMPQPMELPAPSSGSDPYAFHSMMNRREQRSTDLSRANYDATAVDYDTAGDPFAFHSATRKPADQEYHLSGFNSFRSAGAIARNPAGGGSDGDPAPAGNQPVAIGDPAALRRAIIMREILDKPLALRRR